MAETIVAEIRKAIEDGLIKVGDKLPGERQIAEQFSVSRSCVREALRILEVMGMTEVRQGSGATVVSSAYGLENPNMWLAWLAAHRQEVLSLLDVRDAIEGKICSLAARHAPDHDLVALKNILESARGCTVDPKLAFDLDKEFHEALARSAGNKLLAKLSKSIGGALTTDRRAVFFIEGRIERSVQEHWRVYEALVAREPELARQAMDDHIESVKADITRQDTPERLAGAFKPLGSPSGR